MKIYTKTGDQGKTSLVDGRRVEKYSDRIEAYGTVDELNSYIGLLLSANIDASYKDVLIAVQHNLFNIGSILATENPEKVKIEPISNEAIEQLEQNIDAYQKEVAPLRNFILPGGHISASYCHIARCVCRRAERLSVKLANDNPIDPMLIVYLNRLSDFLFVLARKLNRDFNIEEPEWISKKA